MPKFYFILFFLIILASFAVRVYNLNYNSPFNDEAVYIVVGKLQIFQKDFWSYNANAWMGGNSFFYPTASALAYVSGGIVGSRLLNVLFGVLAVEIIFHLTFLLTRGASSFKFLAAVLAALAVSGATSAIYISRLATYDMPAFYFFILGIFLLILAEKNTNGGKWYFLAATFLLLSFLTKIIVLVYLPFVIIYSFVKSRSLKKRRYFFWKRYFILPLALGLFGYFFTTYDSLISFFTLQMGRERVSLPSLMQFFWNLSNNFWWMWIVGSVGLLISGQWRKWVVLTISSLIILLAHLSSFRQISLDKHVFLSIIFLSIIFGIGAAEIVYFIVKRYPPALYTLLGILISILMIHWAFSYQNSKQYNLFWPNTSFVSSFLKEKVKPEDKVLAQSGADVILALYNENFPTNTSTFDFFEYQKYKGEETYIQAVRDGYFNFIQVYQDSTYSKVQKLENKVTESMEDNYKLILKESGFLVYQRNY